RWLEGRRPPTIFATARGGIARSRRTFDAARRSSRQPRRPRPRVTFSRRAVTNHGAPSRSASGEHAKGPANDYRDRTRSAPEVGWPGASQPPAPTDPGVTVSRHRALLTGLQGSETHRQWANRPGARSSSPAHHRLNRLWVRSRLYFFPAQRRR